MTDSINIVILAAGKGTRLKIETPKPLVPALGAPIVDYVIDGLEDFCEEEKLPSQFGVVVGYKKEEVQNHLEKKLPNESVNFAHQKQQLGTGHALQTYFDEYPEALEREYTLVVCADTPLIKTQVYKELLLKLKNEELDAVCASFTAEDPFGYGRIKRAEIGFSIIEEKDATANQKRISEVNSALYIFKTTHIKKHINNLNNKNKSGEFYLTDLFQPDELVGVHQFSDGFQFLGVNNLVQLEEAELKLRERINEFHMLNGVRIRNSKSVFIEKNVQIDSGVVIKPNVSLQGDVCILADTILEEGVIIKNSNIGKRNIIKANSYLEGCNILNDSVIGPMARLREGSNIGDNCKLGNFVETKKVELGTGVKISHLSYAGDAEIGENTNIGCGFITCNYDGASKHKTRIGADTFIGSDCQMVAPVSIGNKAYIGSGSTINKDVPDGAFAIARQRQSTKESMAKKFLKKK